MRHKTKKNKKYYLDDEDRIGVDKESLRRRERREFNPQKMKQLYTAYAAHQAAILEDEEEENEDEDDQSNENIRIPVVKNGSH